MSDFLRIEEKIRSYVTKIINLYLTLKLTMSTAFN
jgi:hypothetical protein